MRKPRIREQRVRMVVVVKATRGRRWLGGIRVGKALTDAASLTAGAQEAHLGHGEAPQEPSGIVALAELKQVNDLCF